MNKPDGFKGKQADDVVLRIHPKRSPAYNEAEDSLDLSTSDLCQLFCDAPIDTLLSLIFNNYQVIGRPKLAKEMLEVLANNLKMPEGFRTAALQAVKYFNEETEPPEDMP